jgi:Na+-driven multidrug efflux pump
MRQLLMLIPLLLILPDYFGLDGVWWSMPVSDFLSTVVAAVLLAYQFKSFKKGEMK